ncbi:MAG: alpha amylase C-terminal domain-containing protein, partial [Candidatus Thiodiazotropha sp. 6PLUC3]
EILVVLNFTPVPRDDYRIGVNQAGEYKEIMNSDSEFYGGTNMGNGSILVSGDTPWMGRDQSITLTLPPLGAIILKRMP